MKEYASQNGRVGSYKYLYFPQSSYRGWQELSESTIWSTEGQSDIYSIQWCGSLKKASKFQGPSALCTPTTTPHLPV